MVTCRPNIYLPLIKLSQYSAKPALEHSKAVQEFYDYSKATISDGIYYWRAKPRMDLPVGPTPKAKDNNKYIADTRE